MARVFPEDSPWLDKENVPESLEKIERYLRYMQERIEHDSYSKSVYDQRQNEEIALVVKRNGTSVEINDDAIQTAAGIDGLSTRITQNANSITTLAGTVSTVNNTVSTMQSTVTQTAQDIQSVVSRIDTQNGNILTTNSSVVTQTATSIQSVVQNIGSNGTVTAASIVQAVNNAGSSVKISADHITLSGDVVLKSNLTDGSTQISGSNITTGTINAQNVNVTNINGQNVLTAVANATNAGTADYLNTALSGFSSRMMTYIITATRTATDYSGGLEIGGSSGVKLFAYGDAFTIRSKSNNNAQVRFTPYGEQLTKYGGSGTVTVFMTVQKSNNELYGIGLEGSTPTPGFVRLANE